MKGIVLITGASGFLGDHLCRHFTQQGWEVRPLVRKPETYPGAFRFDLGGSIDESAFNGRIEALIHCAYEMDPKNLKASATINVEGARRLLELSKRHQVRRFVFVSSLAATDEAESFYGRSKLQIERLLDPERDLIIRPGMIIGSGGLFQRIRESIRKYRIVPLFYGGNQQVQTIWIGDLCSAIEKMIIQELSGVFAVAEPDPIPIRDFYQGVASLEGKKCLFISLPGTAALNLLRLSERLGIRLPITSENLLGLRHLQSFDVRRSLENISFKPRRFKESISLL